MWSMKFMFCLSGSCEATINMSLKVRIMMGSDPWPSYSIFLLHACCYISSEKSRVIIASQLVGLYVCNRLHGALYRREKLRMSPLSLVQVVESYPLLRGSKINALSTVYVGKWRFRGQLVLSRFRGCPLIRSPLSEVPLWFGDFI